MDNVVFNFFIGLIDIKFFIIGNIYVFLLIIVLEDLWFNIFIYFDGGLYGIVVIQFIYDFNDLGVFEDG